MSYENFPYSNFHELNADWILKQVRECVKKVADLGLSFEQLKEYVNNYFSSLDVDSAIAEEIRRLIDNGTMGALINQTLLGDINSKVDSVAADVFKMYVQNESHIVTVGKSAKGAMYTSINSAINYVRARNVSNSNRYTIIIQPGEYTEQLVLNDVHGLSIIGTSAAHGTSIVGAYAYPDCLIHAQGDLLFKNLTLINRSTGSSDYCVHVDPLNTSVTGAVYFEDCTIISNGASSIGYGSGANTGLYVRRCILGGVGWTFYAHNSAYAGKSGQVLELRDCLFLHRRETHYICIDDAGYSNGGVSSQMIVVISGCTHTAPGYGKVLFRKATGVQSTWLSYLPNDDANIRCGTGCCNNSGINGANVIEGHFVTSMVGTSPADSAGKIYVTAPIPPNLNANNYNIAVTACNVDGVNHGATFLNKGISFYQFTIDGVGAGGAHNWQVNVEFTVA